MNEAGDGWWGGGWVDALLDCGGFLMHEFGVK